MISGSLPPIRALILSILSPPKKVRFSDFDIPDGREHKKPLGQFRSLDRAVVGRDGDTVGLRSHGAMITAEQMRNCVSPIDRIVQMTDIRIESEPAGPVALELHTL